MTAYGAVISLKNTIENIFRSSRLTVVNELSVQIIAAAYYELPPLHEILERLNETRTSRSRKKVNALDGRIKEKIWEFEDKLESLLTDQILAQIPAAEQVDVDGGIKETTVWQFQSRLLESHIPSQFEFQSPLPLLFFIDVECLQGDVDSLTHALHDMKKEYIYELENMPQEPISTIIGFDYDVPKSKMIGFSDHFQQIKSCFMKDDHGETYVHQIIGMAGIGKTILAKELYEDADIVSHFDCRAWVTVTRTMVHEGPQLGEVVQGILEQLCLCGSTPIQEDENIGDYLEGKRCLLVLDDVWEPKVCYRLEDSLHYIKNGLVLCILLTTRGIALFASGNTKVRFLNEEESKDLLCYKVFGDRHLCPPQLDKAATKIAKKCEGLPLMIVTVADFLSKSENREPDYWEDVAEERNSVFTDAYNEISKVLYPSYDYLPQHLKMLFLYLGNFPLDYEIPYSKLINMLNAEGWFIEPDEESLQHSVWHCLLNLCKLRYLVLYKTSSMQWDTTDTFAKYKTCWLHSSWRYVCRVEARKNKLYHVLKTLFDSSGDVAKGQRGLCLQNNILFGIKEFCNSVRLNCASFARSLLFVGPYHQYPTPIDVGFRLLRELDALQLRFYTFPTEILTLVQLKYLALTCNGELPSTISKLFNLRVLIVHPHMSIRCCRAPSYVPAQIWDMQELEHIEILGKNLRVPNHVASLEKLLTLIGVNASVCTILELSSRIPNIRKLGVRVELMPYDDHSDLLSCFACISKLESLKILKCSIINPVIQYRYIVHAPPSSLILPHGLRKLHLSGMGYPWEYMDVIGSLPSLEVLKLRSYAFRGSNWEAPLEAQFQSLKFLLVEDSDLVCLNLSPNLTHLCLKHCYKLERIHWKLCGEKKIELVDCSPLAFTWAKELKASGFPLHVTISSSFEEKPMIIEFISRGRDNDDTNEKEVDDEDLAGKGEDDEGIV